MGATKIVGVDISSGGFLFFYSYSILTPTTEMIRIAKKNEERECTGTEFFVDDASKMPKLGEFGMFFRTTPRRFCFSINPQEQILWPQSFCWTIHLQKPTWVIWSRILEPTWSKAENLLELFLSLMCPTGTFSIIS